VTTTSNLVAEPIVAALAAVPEVERVYCRMQGDVLHVWISPNDDSREARYAIHDVERQVLQRTSPELLIDFTLLPAGIQCETGEAELVFSRAA